MTVQKKITLITLLLLTLIALAIAVFMPFNSRLSSLDFHIFDSNDNYHYEVGEELEFYLNDTNLVKDRELIWHFGNGDTINKSGNVSYKYNKEGKYLISLGIDNKYTVSKYIKVISVPQKTPLDSISRIHGVDEGYVGEELVFSTEGQGIDTWYWEFGETGTVDAYERQVIYRYTKPGTYNVKLQTNVLKYPVFHQIKILPRFEKVEELEAVDSLELSQNDIRKKLQAIADSKVSDKRTFYKSLNYIKDKYTCNHADDVVVVINGARYNDLYSYCQGLHYLERKKKNKVLINKVQIDTFKCFKKMNVTQSLLE